MSDKDTVVVEHGTCPHCGEVEAEDEEFEFRYGPRCPACDSVLEEARAVEKPKPESIVSDTDATDLLGGDDAR